MTQELSAPHLIVDGNGPVKNVHLADERCAKCGSGLARNGTQRRVLIEPNNKTCTLVIQRYKCCNCGCISYDLGKLAPKRSQYSYSFIKLIWYKLALDVPIVDIARQLRIKRDLVYKWRAVDPKDWDTEL